MQLHQCGGCQQAWQDYQSYANHHCNQAHNQINQHQGNYPKTGGLMNPQQMGYGHSGPCQPGCTCDFARASQQRNEDLVTKIESLRSELRAQHLEILGLLMKLTRSE